MIGFIVILGLAGVKAFDQAQLVSLGNLSRWAFLFTFAGVGLRINIREMLKQGLRSFLVGAIGMVSIAFLTLLLVLVADRFFGL